MPSVVERQYNCSLCRIAIDWLCISPSINHDNRPLYRLAPIFTIIIRLIPDHLIFRQKHLLTLLIRHFSLLFRNIKAECRAFLNRTDCNIMKIPINKLREDSYLAFLEKASMELRYLRSNL
jgi:hypothetical protein